MILGGIFSSTRQAIKGPAVVEGKTLYIYPEQYEGQEYDPLLFCTGPVPAQQVEPLIPWLMERTGAKTFFLPSADYIWPHVMNKKVHEVATAAGGRSSERSTSPSITPTTARRSTGSTPSGADVVFNTIVPPGLHAVLRAAPRLRLHASVAGSSSARTSTRTSSASLPAEQVEGLYGCIDYYHDVSDPFSQELLGPLRRALPGRRPCSPPAARAPACTAA